MNIPALQNLAPQDAHLCLRTGKICRQILGIKPGSRLLLALSGGPDSLALSLLLLILASRLEVELAALHVNHHLRRTSDVEAEFVMSFCKNAGLPCAVAHANVNAIALAGKCGLEEAGRLARRKLLENHRKAIGADFILTGHHAEDLAEDIVMRMLRGAGWPALAGMAWRNGHILHPLLRESPERLKAFLRDNNCEWVNDESNQSLAFRRNRIRHLLMPLLRCENPAITHTMGRIHDLGQLDADYWQTELDKALATHPWQFDPCSASLVLPKALLMPLHPAARLRLYHRALAELRYRKSDHPGQTRADSLMRLEEVFRGGIGGKVIQCSGGITATLKRGDIILRLDSV